MSVYLYLTSSSWSVLGKILGEFFQITKKKQFCPELKVACVSLSFDLEICILSCRILSILEETIIETDF